jgi:hypothetical protein
MCTQQWTSDGATLWNRNQDCGCPIYSIKLNTPVIYYTILRVVLLCSSNNEPFIIWIDLQLNSLLEVTIWPTRPPLGLMVRVPDYRSRDLGSIPCATRFSEKWWVWNEVHSASWVQLKSCLEEKVAAQVYKSENTSVGDPQSWLRDTPLSSKVGTNFADKRKSLKGSLPC